jgi:NAD(P)H-hydrate repair Nnr-like enzyme with NAD(P)H-hydrate epimerase domain
MSSMRTGGSDPQAPRSAAVIASAAAAAARGGGGGGDDGGDALAAARLRLRRGRFGVVAFCGAVFIEAWSCARRISG